MRLLALLLLVGACGGGGGAAASSGDLDFCHSEVNRYRALASKPALTRSAELDAFAAACAERDGMARVPHTCFRESDAGVAAAETETLNFSYAGWGSIVGVIREGLAEIAVEGTPSWRTLTGDFTQLGCGVARMGDEVTVVESYR